MEVLQVLVLLFVGFVAWLYLAKFITNNYEKSRGLSSIFWWILLLGTLSFLFGSSSGGNGGFSGGGNDDYYDDDDCYSKNWFDNDNDSCSFDFDGDD